MLNALESYPTLQNTLHSIVSTGLPHGLPSQLWQARGCSSGWHLHSRFPSGTLVPPDSHLLFLGLSEAQTQQSFFTHCRSNSALTLRDSLFFPQTHCSCSHKNATLSEVAHEWFHKPFGLHRGHGEKTRNTVLLLLPTGPVKLLAWLELWKMWASPAFPQVSTGAGKATVAIYCTVEHCWRKNSLSGQGWELTGLYIIGVDSTSQRYQTLCILAHSTHGHSTNWDFLCDHGFLLSCMDSPGHGQKLLVSTHPSSVCSLRILTRCSGHLC